jgi:DUF1365 family protein
MRNPLEPGVMRGWVRHRRFEPAEHEFRYPLFMGLLDIDRVEEAMAVSRWASAEKFNVLSLRARDYLWNREGTLRQRLEAEAEASGIQLPGGRILLLTHLRYLGYGFNPISLFYCLNEAGEVELVGAEVHSTFGERHLYWLNAANRDERGFHHARKRLYVSPFNGMDNEYRFGLAHQKERITVQIDTYRDGKRFFDATLGVDWEPWTAGALHRAMAAYPLMTLQVVGAIHWEACQLFFKRVPYVPHLKDKLSA